MILGRQIMSDACLGKEPLKNSCLKLFKLQLSQYLQMEYIHIKTVWASLVPEVFAAF